MRAAELARRLEELRRLRNERVRRLVLEEGRVDVLAEHVLGYEVLPFHGDMIAFQSAHRENLCLAPRGYGKSTVLTVTRAIFEVVRDPNIRILICSKTALQAEVFLREIKHHLESNQTLLAIFGQQRGAKWDTTEIVVAGKTAPWKESTITTLGVGGPVASRHYDLIIGDDLVDEKNARTEVQREHVRTWYLKTLYPTVVDETSRVYLVGTRFHPLDMWQSLMAHDQDLSSMVVRAIERDGSTPWPAKFSLARLEALRQKMGTAIFNSQYQNDTEAMKGAIFKEEWFRFYDEWPRRLDADGKPVVRRDARGNLVGTLGDWEDFDGWGGCDPAATKKAVLLTGRKSETDWWTIAVAYRERDEEGRYGSQIFFRYLWRARCTKDAYVVKINEVYRTLKPRPISMGCESVAAQEYLIQDLQRIGIPVEPVERKVDKVSRAFRLQAFFENAQIVFPSPALQGECGGREVWQAAIEELLLFPEAEHDDLFDAIETACDLAFAPRGIEAFWD